MLFSLHFQEAPTMVALKMFQCINVRFVGIVYSAMVNISSKLTHFK